GWRSRQQEPDGCVGGLLQPLRSGLKSAEAVEVGGGVLATELEDGTEEALLLAVLGAGLDVDAPRQLRLRRDRLGVVLGVSVEVLGSILAPVLRVLLALVLERLEQRLADVGGGLPEVVSEGEDLVGATHVSTSETCR